MNEGIKKFRDLLLTDEKFQQKLKAAAEAYTGEQTEEAVFSEVLVPLAQEYGISATYDEFHEYVTNGQEMDKAELEQLAGGKSGGSGTTACIAIGYGIGGGGGDGTGGACLAIGGGWGLVHCWGSGKTNAWV